MMIDIMGEQKFPCVAQSSFILGTQGPEHTEEKRRGIAETLMHTALY